MPITVTREMGEAAQWYWGPSGLISAPRAVAKAVPNLVKGLRLPWQRAAPRVAPVAHRVPDAAPPSALGHGVPTPPAAARVVDNLAPSASEAAPIKPVTVSFLRTPAGQKLVTRGATAGLVVGGVAAVPWAARQAGTAATTIADAAGNAAKKAAEGTAGAFWALAVPAVVVVLGIVAVRKAAS